MKSVDIESLRFENLNFSHGEEDKILDEVSFDFPMNCNVWVGGNSGSGKSTLIKVLAALLEPNSGHYWFNDIDVTNASFEEFLPYRIQIGYSTDYGGLLSNKTLSENILLPVMYHQGHSRDLKVWAGQLMETFGLSSVRGSRPASVTGTARKAAVLARAFALKPQVVFLDNPTEGLDRGKREALNEIILQGRKDGWLRHVFISSGDRRIAESLNCVKITVHSGKLDCISVIGKVAV